jgi:chromate reductase
MADKVNVITISGSLRKGSFNAALARQLPKFAPEGMSITAAPAWADLPIYNADDQNSTGFPATATKLADAIRAADGVIIVSPEYNYGVPCGLKNAVDWV